MSRIADRFAQARREGRVAFIPYLTAGDPSEERTVELVGVLAECGADLVELGVPFSDPLADGEVNQRAAQRALGRGVTLPRVLAVAERIRRRWTIPLILFTYYNPVLRRGLPRFAREAKDAGIDGVLVTDLPVEEGEDLRRALGSAGLDSVFLIAPTTQPERIRRIGDASTGFIYYVSRPGVTGERDSFPPDVAERVTAIRAATGKPVAVGFGVSRPEHVAEISGFADGVVIGSALVRLVEECGEREDLAVRLEKRVKDLLSCGRSK